MTNKERTNELTQKAKESYKIYSDDKCIDTYEGYQYIDGYCNGYEQGYEDCRHYAHDYYKPKWHDLREDPNDLPKESNRYLCAWEGGEQWIMDFETEVNSFGYWCNIFDNQSLGFVDSEFETIKERGEDEVIAWCELPKFEE